MAEPAAGAEAEGNPWRTLDRRPVYENAWIAVREDRVLRPDGEPGIYGVVHFKNAAVGVLPVEDDGSIWLVGQHRYAIDAYSWEIPEGGAPEGEAPEACARRELREETGLSAAVLERLGCPVHLSNSVSDELAHVFRATGLTPGESRPEGTERLAVRRVAFAEALAMLDRGEISDSMTVVALLREALRRTAQGPRPALEVLGPALAVCRLDPDAATPTWAEGGGLVALTRTADELSIVCEASRVPAAVRAERGWRALKARGPLDFGLTGVLAGLAGPLAAAGLSVLAVSTFETDYLLVRAADLGRAVEVLSGAGFAVSRGHLETWAKSK